MAAYAESAPLIAVASSARFALQDIRQQFTHDTGLQVKLSFGSSGNLVSQISQGGPYQLFLSADEAYVTLLSDKGLTMGEGAVYGVGRLALFVPKSSPIKVDVELQDLRAAVDDGRLKRISIANPQHAPYGRAAKQALVTTGLWSLLQSHLVLGENVAQATQFASSGAAQGAIIAYSVAITPMIKPLGKWVLLPETWHQPLRQRMVLLKRAGKTAKAFYRYLLQPKAQQVLARYGFFTPASRE